MSVYTDAAEQLQKNNRAVSWAQRALQSSPAYKLLHEQNKNFSADRLNALLAKASASSSIAAPVQSTPTETKKNAFRVSKSNTDFWGTPTPMMGGLTPQEARRILKQVLGENRAKKSLFLLEITSSLQGGQLNMPERFNLFATDVEYSPFIIEGEKIKVGGTSIDAVSGNEAVELSITTLDDEQGSLKKWFAAHHLAAASRDGTVSEPGKYAIKVRIVHAACTDELASKLSGYESLGLFRTANLAVSLSRREDALEELQMTFSQLDTFMRP